MHIIPSQCTMLVSECPIGSAIIGNRFLRSPLSLRLSKSLSIDSLKKRDSILYTVPPPPSIRFA
jgi:hypothetical protein